MGLVPGTIPVSFQGKRMLVTSKVIMRQRELTKINISYIENRAPTKERRKKLQKHFHFDCLCDSGVGIQLGKVAGEPVNQQLAMVVVQRRSLVEAMQEMAIGQGQGQGLPKQYQVSQLLWLACHGWPSV